MEFSSQQRLAPHKAVQGGVISPLLANAILDHMDWTLHENGYQFSRYADDFVIVCKSKKEAKEVKNLVESTLNELGLEISKEKTKITTYGKGYDFLGFKLSSRSRRMRHKSVKKFKDKIRELTIRKHNFDEAVIVKLNQVIRGTANYFATNFSTCRWMFQKLDSWIRMRLRCMKKKRKSNYDNLKMRVKNFSKLGLLSLESFCVINVKEQKVIPCKGQSAWGRPVTERVTPVNVGN